MLAALSKGFNSIKEVCFCLLVAIHYRLSRILREHLVFNNELMQIVSKEVCASIPTMAIKYAKEAAFRPVFDIFFSWWLHYI